MKKVIKSGVCILVAVLFISTVAIGPAMDAYGADAVSGASQTAEGYTETPQTQPAAPAPKVLSGTGLLVLGSSGSQVAMLQELLNANGYDLNVDGIFGIITENAVRDYQAKNGLYVDGVVGPKTLANLKEEKAAEVDAVTTASIVSSKEALSKAIGADGTWIVCTLNDLTFDQPLVIEGEFRNKDDVNKDLYRKLGLYTQDEDHNIIESFTLTAPKLTIKSPNTRIQGGTFVGDVYVETANFTLRDATIDGNLYFASEELKSTFNSSSNGTVTGTISINEPVDAVTTASIVSSKEAFLEAIGAHGTWIVCTLNDLTFDQALVMEGEFRNKDDANNDLYRKLGLYTQDEDHNIIESFTLTAPRLTIKSPNPRLQGGTFVGDVYVDAMNFTLRDATIRGNLYFANDEQKATFDSSRNGVVTGEVGIKVERPPLTLPSANDRTLEDYAEEFKALTGATEVGEVMYPERNEVRYAFLPLIKDGEVFAYGSWVTVPIYQHTEDLIMVVNPDGTLRDFKAIDANSHHPLMNADEWRNRFIGKDYTTLTYNPNVDTNAGSTISSSMFTAEIRITLFIFDNYIKPNL